MRKDMQNWWSRTGWRKREQDANLPKVLRAQAIQLWQERIVAHAKQVDAKSEHDWVTLAYGFFLGQGFAPTAAMEMALEVEK